MFRRIRALGANPVTFWVVAMSAIAVWSLIPSYRMGWDFLNFRSAIVSLPAGHDPYSDDLNVQTAYHNQLQQNPDVPAPLSYVYSPATLPLLRLVGHLPFALSGTLYWILYAGAFAVILWAGLQCAEEDERKIMLCLAPYTVFFPGLLQSDVLFSGNVAILLYAGVLTAAVVGWRKEKWFWFYAITLVASFFKAPMLSLLAIPVLSSRKQWLPAAAAAASGVAVFCAQPTLWPSLFANYLKILDSMFRLQKDFSSSPTGILTEMLYGNGNYKTMLAKIYIFYAVPVFCILLYLAHRYFAERLTIKQWAPVMLIGVVLLNPRIIEYDVTPITIPIMLVMWRGFAKNNAPRDLVLKLAVLFGAGNLLSIVDLPIVHLAWRWTECAILMGTFIGGSASLYLQSREEVSYVETYIDEVVFEDALAEEMAL